MRSTGFVHLHCRSAYSLLEGTATPQALVSAAKRLRMPALALTDRNSLYGVVRFYAQAQKAGVKPIIGMEVDLDDGRGGSHSLVLLARSLDGYRNLYHLSSIMRLNADPAGFSPAGFDNELDMDTYAYVEDDDRYRYVYENSEIEPWDEGIWGVPVFGVTGKPAPVPPVPLASAFTSRLTREPLLPRELLLSGRHTPT